MMGFLDSLFFGFEVMRESLENGSAEEDSRESIETTGDDVPSKKTEEKANE